MRRIFFSHKPGSSSRLRKRSFVSCFPDYNPLFHTSQFITSGMSIFIQFNYTRKLQPVFLKKNKIPIIEPPVFLNQFYRKIIISFPQAPPTPHLRIVPPVPPPPPPKIPPGVPRRKIHIDKVTTGRTSTTWDMSKSRSIYLWDNVDNIIQVIESPIDFISHTTDLYDSEFCLK